MHLKKDLKLTYPGLEEAVPEIDDVGLVTGPQRPPLLRPNNRANIEGSRRPNVEYWPKCDTYTHTVKVFN